jgi:TonB family protein
MSLRDLLSGILLLCLNAVYSQEFSLPYVERDPVYDIAPQFPGGSDEMMRYFADSVRYPEPERSQRKEGPVLVAFTITKKGRVTGVRIVNGVPGAPNLAAEARRMLEIMPWWHAARKKGKRVAAEVQLSIPFRITAPGPER